MMNTMTKAQFINTLNVFPTNTPVAYADSNSIVTGSPLNTVGLLLHHIQSNNCGHELCTPLIDWLPDSLHGKVMPEAVAVQEVGEYLACCVVYVTRRRRIDHGDLLDFVNDVFRSR